jgi:thiopeptide-type bacteriocin biosynthesis protein
VAPALLESLSSADGLIDRTVVDTYNREEDRYGGPAAMDVAERLFEADSDAAVAIIREYGGDLDARWVLALYGMDALMSDFGLSVQDKRATVLRCHAAQMSAFSNDRRQRRKVGDRYRAMRSQIEAVFGGSAGPLQRGLAIIRSRSAELRRLAAELRGLEQSGPLTFPIDVTLESYLHMWANRVLRTAINPQESVLYDFLGRIYQRPQFGFASQSLRAADA